MEQKQDQFFAAAAPTNFRALLAAVANVPALRTSIFDMEFIRRRPSRRWPPTRLLRECCSFSAPYFRQRQSRKAFSFLRRPGSRGLGLNLNLQKLRPRDG